SAHCTPMLIRNPIRSPQNDRPAVRHDRAKGRHRSRLHRPAERCAERTRSGLGCRRDNVIENKTRENMERIFKSAKDNGYDVFISPHYFYPTDSHWKFDGPLEADEFKHHVFARSGPLTLAGFANSGADWVDRFKPYIEDGKTIVVS